MESIKIYIEETLANAEALKAYITSQGGECVSEADATIFIRDVDTTFKVHPYDLFNRKCVQGIFEKTLFLSCNRDWLNDYPTFSRFFHPKDTSGTERLFLFDESICIHLQLPCAFDKLYQSLLTLNQTNK